MQTSHSSPHASGQWAKTIRGKQVYFGKWDDWKAAKAKYDAQYPPDGQPARTRECTTLADLLNTFRRQKRVVLEEGELTQRSFDEYTAVCDRIAATIDPHRDIQTIGSEDLSELKKVLCRSKAGEQLSPSSQKRLLTMARMVFKFANDELEPPLARPIRYKKILQPPSAKVLRKARNKVGPRLFAAEEIRALLEIAKPQLKAMIYLGINCGFGNRDCATLPIEQLDLALGWHTYWRPKTEIARRCPLWPETAAALYAVVKDRTGGLVFMTKYGKPWYSDTGGCPISYEFRKLVKELKIGRNGITTFYSLRRTFETIGATAGEQLAVDYIMGHTPASDDMAAVYRQKTFDAPLIKVTERVRDWLQGSITIV